MAATENEVIRNHAAFIWSVADLLRGDFKRSEYGRVILPRRAGHRRRQHGRAAEVRRQPMGRPG